jgi:hypothetical protein
VDGVLGWFAAVSLLDGRETVTVYVEESFTDSFGDTKVRPSETGTVVTGVLMQPMSTLRMFPSLDPTQQQRVYSTWRLIARDAPLGTWSRVVWNGMSMSVRSGPEYRHYSGATSHVTALLQEER